jgi:hypothetical protein
MAQIGELGLIARPTPRPVMTREQGSVVEFPHVVGLHHLYTRRRSEGRPPGSCDRANRASTERGPGRSRGCSPALAVACRLRASDTRRFTAPIWRSSLPCITIGVSEAPRFSRNAPWSSLPAPGWSFCHPTVSLRRFPPRRCPRRHCSLFRRHARCSCPAAP